MRAVSLKQDSHQYQTPVDAVSCYATTSHTDVAIFPPTSSSIERLTVPRPWTITICIEADSDALLRPFHQISFYCFLDDLEALIWKSKIHSVMCVSPEVRSVPCVWSFIVGCRRFGYSRLWSCGHMIDEASPSKVPSG